MNSAHWSHHVESLPLHRAPCMHSFPFFPMCVRCIHDLQYIFCWNKVNPNQDVCDFQGFSDRPEWFVSRRKILGVFMRRWLGVTDDWRRGGPGRSTFMLTDETKAMTSATFSTNKQKTHSSVDLRPNRLSAALWYDPLVSESIKNSVQWQQYQCKISWRGMEL